MVREDLTSLTKFRGHQYASVIGVLPVECVTGAEVTLPEKNVGLFVQSLPYILEDDLLPGVADQHYAVGAPDTLRHAAVHVVAASALKRLVDAATDAELVLDAAYVDAALVPSEGEVESQRLNLLHYNGQWLCRTDNAIWSLHDLQLDMLADWLPLHSIPGVLWHLPPGEDAPVMPGRQFAGLEADIARLETFSDTTLFLAEQALLGEAVNLLQGRFAPADRGRSIRIAVAACGVISTLILIASIYLFSMGMVVERRADELHDAVVQQYREYFPQSERVFNVRKQIESHLRGSAAAPINAPGFVDFISDFSRAWAASTMGEAWIRHLRFTADDQRAAIEIDNTLVPQVEALQQALRLQGLEAQVLSAVASKDQPDASLIRLRVEGGSGAP